MTMHLVRGMSSLSTKKRKGQGLTSQDRQAAADHDKWLRKMGTHPDQLKARKKKPVNTLPFERDRSHERQGNDAPSIGSGVGGLAPKAESKKYTGTKIIGIATMHKSNMGPVMSKEDASEISKMRR